MHVVLKKQEDGTFKKVRKKFADYKSAHRYVCNIFYRKEDGLHWAFSLKYLLDGYSKKKIFPFGILKFKRNGIEYKIQEQL